MSLGQGLGIDHKKLRQESVYYIKKNALQNIFFYERGFFNENLLNEYCNNKKNTNIKNIKQIIKEQCGENTNDIFEDFIKKCENINNFQTDELFLLFKQAFIEDYTNCMSEDKTYAGLFELYAISQIYNICINIYTKKEDIYEKYAIINQEECNKTINLLYTAYSQHYELLIISS